MSSPEILPFDSEHLEGAAEVLAVRHRRHREAEPLLAATYEDPQACRELIAAAYAADDASGSVAVDGSRVVGYLLGAPKSETWGQNIWVESAGHAVEEPELARELYAVAATRWLDEGRTGALRAAALARRRPGARRGSGWRSAGSTRTPSASPPRPDRSTRGSPSVSRSAARSRQLARLDMVLPEHQHQSPCFSGGPLDVYEERVADWEEDFDNPKFWNVVVEHDGAIVGSAVGCALEVSSSHVGPANPGQRRLPRLRGCLPGGPRARRRPGAGRGGVRVGAA